MNWIFRKNEENLQMLFDTCRMEDGKISVKLFLEVCSILYKAKLKTYVVFFILWFISLNIFLRIFSKVEFRAPIQGTVL